MAETIELKNVSFRVVGVFLRVNQPYTAVETPKPAPFSFDFETLKVEQPATVGSVMVAIRDELSAKGFDFKFDNLPSTNPGKDALLQTISFGETGKQPFVMNATDISRQIEGISPGPNDEPLVAAWQYYVFAKDDFGRDQRVEVSGRSPYGKSVVIRDNMRIIWRLIITYRGNTQIMSLA